jgi:DnaD/phage-associated family protein
MSDGLGRAGENVNYIREINAFYDWLETNGLDASCIALWHALMAIANRAGWPDEFAVAISTLQAKTGGLSRDSVERARNKLSQAGLITWRSRKGRQSAVYSINSLCRTEAAQDTVQHAAQRTAQDTVQHAAHGAAITKQNETKQNNKQDDVGKLAHAFYEIFRHFPNGVQQQDMLEYLDKGMQADLIIADMKTAARRNKPFSYALKIMKNQYMDGILTVEQAELLESQREAAAASQRNGGKPSGTHRTSPGADSDWEAIEAKFFGGR